MVTLHPERALMWVGLGLLVGAVTVACNRDPQPAGGAPKARDTARTRSHPSVGATIAPADPFTAPADASHLPGAIVNAPYAPAVGHSAIDDAVIAVDANSIYGRRSRDPAAPAIRIVGSSSQPGAPLTELAELLTVRASPEAAVSFYATALGTFANGTQAITVAAGADGLAAVSFKPGQDPGDYQVIATCPACSGVATFTIPVVR